MRVGVLLVGISAGLGMVAAKAVAPDVRLGLWEVTRTTSHQGDPGIDTSKMSPAQRAKVKALEAKTAAPQTVVSKYCLTPAKLQKNAFLEKAVTDPSCERTVVTDTPADRDIQVVCSGHKASNADIHFQALSPESVKVEFTLTSTDAGGGSPYTVASTSTAKWLSEDCGRVR